MSVGDELTVYRTRRKCEKRESVLKNKINQQNRIHCKFCYLISCFYSREEIKFDQTF